MLVPIFPENKLSFEERGGRSIMFFSGFSRPRANAGKLSVTRFINKICDGRRKMQSRRTIVEMKIPRTSTAFVESKNKIIF